MHMHKKVLVLPAVAIAVLAGAAPALAADDPSASPSDAIATAPPEQPGESDLVENAPETAAAAPTESVPSDDDLPSVPTSKTSATPDVQGCEPGWRYYATSKDKDYHKGVGAEQANHNGTSRTAKSTFTSETSGTVGIAFSGELKVSGPVLVTEVEGKFGVNVSTSLTTKIGNSISVDTPAKTTTFGRYGVYRLKSYGYSQYVYVNCGRGSKKNVTTYTPHRIGWAIWEKKD
ncbi:hypothetical protein ABZT17_41035 [Streptomyces sp. NPDC005648]|uniref:hypothetical protein n=1 Tax=Streptomyces sp. NPDC005648 TaxID=3157044 RepID=UPI0033BB5A81